jgi:hypothetical protein
MTTMTMQRHERRNETRIAHPRRSVAPVAVGPTFGGGGIALLAGRFGMRAAGIAPVRKVNAAEVSAFTRSG